MMMTTNLGERQTSPKFTLPHPIKQLSSTREIEKNARVEAYTFLIPSNSKWINLDTGLTKVVSLVRTFALRTSP